MRKASGVCRDEGCSIDANSTNCLDTIRRAVSIFLWRDGVKANRYSFLECEPGIWMVLVVAEGGGEWGEVDDTALHSLIHQIYETITVFNGG